MPSPNWKPERGSGKLERLARKTAKAGITARLRHRKRLANVQGERQAKAEVRERDQVCRWPGCDCRELHPVRLGWDAPEVAHVVTHKGAGGDPTLVRTQRHLMLLLCRYRHRGPFGVDSGRSRVELMTEAGTDGPCEFFYEQHGRYERRRRWFSAGVSTPPQEQT